MMTIDPYLVLMIAAIVALYIVMVISFKRSAKKARALRSFYLPETIGLGEDSEKRDELASLCIAMLSMIGVNVSQVRKDMYTELGRAGLSTENQVAYFLFFRWYIQFFFLLIAGLILFVTLTQHVELASIDGITRLLFVFILGAIGLGGHTVLLDKLEKKRKDQLILSFPDTLDLLLVCIEAGMPLDTALARVCRELKRSHPLITNELDRTRIELGVYGDRTQSLQNLADRTDIKGFRSLVSALIQTEKYGTNLADTLRVLSEDFRTERLLNAENRAARVPALITVPVVLFVFFPFMVLIMAPPIIEFLEKGGWPD